MASRRILGLVVRLCALSMYGQICGTTGPSYVYFGAVGSVCVDVGLGRAGPDCDARRQRSSRSNRRNAELWMI